MPKPIDEAQYRPAFDGIRSIAVILVVLYHLGTPGFSGGLLGVAIFFTLSGYLITSILLRSVEVKGRLGLRTFWVRRARRLLPAVVLTLTAVLAVTAATDRAHLAVRAKEAVFGLFYVANWGQVARGDSYFVRTSARSPLEHLWSLSVEEQFYVVWPVLLALLLLFTKRRKMAVAAVASLLAAVSFAWLYLEFQPAHDNTRAYIGTDTRAGGLLIGAAVALAVHDRLPRWIDLLVFTRLMSLVGVLGVAGMTVIVMTTNEFDSSLYTYGLLALSVATAATLLACEAQRSVVARMLSIRPLVWLGERSYGIYLWHLPVIVSMGLRPNFLGGEWTRATATIVVSVLIAHLSWTLVEDPIRQRGLTTFLLGARNSVKHTTGRLAASTAAIVAVLLVATLGLSAPVRALPTSRAPQAESALADAPTGRTKCADVVHIGDSTTRGLIFDSKTEPLRTRMWTDAYARAGVKNLHLEAKTGRGIIADLYQVKDARAVVKDHRKNGYHGCWVVVLGLNDPEATASGGTPSLEDRVKELMQLIGGEPVLWETTKTLLRSGPNSNTMAEKWNRALRDACHDWPNMRIYDWARVYRDEWFDTDGIHALNEGTQAHAQGTARALVEAFPAQSNSAQSNSASSCVVK